MKMVSVASITPDNTGHTNVLDLGIIFFSLVTFCDRPVISFLAGKIDKKMLTFLELPLSNSLDTPLVLVSYSA
jgi:hypothetical protein